MKNGSLRIINQVLIALSFTVFLSFSSFAEPLNLSVLKKEVETYHDSGAYEKELACVITQAQNYILQQAAINEQHGNKKKLAVVLDVDETSLSNYNRIVKRNFATNLAQIHRDILAADAPAIPPMLSLYHNIRKHRVQIFFVTGRSISELEATKTNLRRAGFKYWAGLYLRPHTYKQLSIAPFKSKVRELITKQGYTIVASIGDQCSDLKGGYAQKMFKLPNPFYYLP